jgi:cytochrome oxidase assembly protein ShyY1
MTLFVVFFLPLTLGLGAWQLSRAAEKEALAARFFAAQGMLPVVADGGATELPPYTRVRLAGRYEADRYFLLDNRTRAGRVGYDVIALFRGRDGRVYFVNRGWVAAPAHRDELPLVTTPAEEVSVTGSIWHELGLRVGRDEDESTAAWPVRVQRFDPRLAIERVPDAVPVEIRLDPGMPGALEARYEAPRFQPERHRGYALQWFGLATALVLLYVHFGLRRGAPR